ncbi:cob(I)yrinic acid a,c-diamide adenosyltransferase [Promethearchaeum syntrophicum]|uniref:Cob(I)yrinic acid a,c-diamide adenosyltransferase n=1 Tax=Promethearchaeum syntrophicum TaxID=2594042 RepID=A0A5B9DD89_9ARCH|nr:cob(I)yrinic acid a,c-diamide adenosyltransferase [Candidatus Prometheoarchaeum syntrophicum]
MSKNQFKTGLIHYYFGMGCGKTSIGLGHIVRALGRNLRTILIQFLKKHDPTAQKGFFYGEYITLTEKLNIPIIQFGEFNFIKSEKQIASQMEMAKNALNKVKEVLTSKKYDLIVLDEVGSMIKLNLWETKNFIRILRDKNPEIEVIITGHQGIPELEDIADYVIHLEEIKHPYQKGILARPGIEF